MIAHAPGQHPHAWTAWARPVTWGRPMKRRPAPRPGVVNKGKRRLRRGARRRTAARSKPGTPMILSARSANGLSGSRPPRHANAYMEWWNVRIRAANDPDILDRAARASGGHAIIDATMHTWVAVEGELPPLGSTRARTHPCQSSGCEPSA